MGVLKFNNSKDYIVMYFFKYRAGIGYFKKCNKIAEGYIAFYTLTDPSPSTTFYLRIWRFVAAIKKNNVRKYFCYAWPKGIFI